MLKKGLVMIFIIIVFIPNTINAFNCIPYDFVREMIEYGYPDKVYKTKPIIEREMSAYGTNLKAFQVKMDKKPSGFLDKSTFIAWQKWKTFNKEVKYIDNHPWSTPDQGTIRTILKPFKITPNQAQFILELESYDNQIIIAFNLKRYPNFATEGVVICGYGKSKKVFHEHLAPMKGLDGYYMIKISLPYNEIFHFHLVKFGINHQSFDNLPFMVSYKKLMEQGTINKEIGRRFYKEKCQVLKRGKNGVLFLENKQWRK